MLTHSGRGAIFLYASSLRRSGRLPSSRNVILAPAFHCPTVIDPLLHAGFEIRYYPVDESLRVRSNEFLEQLDSRVAIAVFIRYFGLTPAETSLYEVVRDCGGRVLEDCSHSFLEGEPAALCSSGAEATTYSFYKLAPVDCGGGLMLGSQDHDLTVALEPAPLVEDVRIMGRILDRTLHEGLASMTRASSGEGTNSPDDSDLQPVVIRTAEDAYPYDASRANWRMPLLSRALLRRVDLNAMAASRRRNYDSLLASFPASSRIRPLLAGRAGNRVPWGFPVIARERASLDYRIRAAGVPVFSFGEVLHPHSIANASVRTRDEAIELSRSVFAIAIHQQMKTEVVADFGPRIQSVLDQY